MYHNNIRSEGAELCCWGTWLPRELFKLAIVPSQDPAESRTCTLYKNREAIANEQRTQTQNAALWKEAQGEKPENRADGWAAPYQ